ncbi:MAG: hypothetical protein ACXWO1_12315 [Isosphaeraceae bacterium]
MKSALLLVVALAAGDGIAWSPEPHYVDGADCRKPLADEARTVLGVRLDEEAVSAAERVLGPSRFIGLATQEQLDIGPQ